MSILKKKIKPPKNPDDQRRRIKKLGKGVKFYRLPKVYTQDEWKSFDVINEKHVNGKVYYLDTHELLCKKYDIILIEYKTRREKAISILMQFNMKNFDKGMAIFDEALKEFDKGMQDFGKELGGSSKGKKTALWGKPSTSISLTGKKTPLFTSITTKKTKRKKRKTKSRDQKNLETLFGKRKTK